MHVHLLTRIVFSLLILGCTPMDALSNNTHSTLEELRTKIADVRSYLEDQQGKRSLYEKQLKDSELKASQLSQELLKTAQSLNTSQTDLVKLKSHSHDYLKELKTQQALLSAQLKAAYIMSQQPYLRLWLNQKNPEKISRNLQYYHYLHQDRMNIIVNLNTLLDKIEINQQQIKEKTQKLADLKVQQQQEQLKLNVVQQDRKRVIQSLNQEINTKNKKLSDLLKNKRALEKTVDTLNQSSTPFVTPGKTFAQLQGKLHWPTQGHISQAFGAQIEHSELHATGVLIRAPMDQAVYVIAPGKVIFSKWMTGYGLLLIIDHGNHYMSLYGRNHSLYKKEGDLVSAGEKIASVGNSGGYPQAALYFALRHNAQALDPSAWCQGRP